MSATISSIPAVPLPERQRDDLDPVPQPLTTFVGRDRDLATVLDLLRRPDLRLLTITGTGGVGKTRLALRATDALGDAFEGTVFVSLASVRDPDMLLPTVAHQLNVPDEPGQPLLARLRAFLAPRRLLLVLDNLEHLLDAVPGVVDLLAGCPRLTVLCTCRTTLNVSGEHLVPLAPLPAEEARELFVERVRALVSDFSLTDAAVPVIDAICERLDGLPLALELAAARVPTLPPPALLARLERRLDLLANGPRDAPARLRGLRDAIDWSHDLLAEEQQILVRRLGVFIGGFTLGAAEAVAGGDVDVLDALSALVAASLIIPTQGVADEPRYTMLETIREYALERLVVAGEEATVRARHAGYYRSLAEDALPLYDGPEIRLAVDRVDIELDNCRAAMAWSLETGNAETGTRLAGALWRVWWFAQAAVGRPWAERITEGRNWIERMLAMQADLPVEAVTEALTGGAALAWLQRDLERGQALSEDLLTRARAEGYPYAEFWALYVLGYMGKDVGKFETAHSYYSQALEVAPAVRNPQNHLAIALERLGALALDAGDLDEAEQRLNEALRLSRETGNEYHIARAAAELGRVLLQQGDSRRAAPLARKSLIAYVNQRDLAGVHAALVDLTLLALKTEQPERAARLLGSASMYPCHPNDTETSTGAAMDAQARLGEATFATASEAGRRMTWDEVLAEIDALIETIPDVSARGASKPAAQHGLSRREVEVLRLLAEGRSNRAIAEVLSISQRTAENHVLHILTKLDLDSRTAAATWAVRHRLA